VLGPVLGCVKALEFEGFSRPGGLHRRAGDEDDRRVRAQLRPINRLVVGRPLHRGQLRPVANSLGAHAQRERWVGMPELISNVRRVAGTIGPTLVCVGSSNPAAAPAAAPCERHRRFGRR
jgi:hypothetical protein